MTYIATRKRRGVQPAVSVAALLFLLVNVMVVRLDAQEQAFQLNGTDITLAESTPDVQVYFQSMRLNRALNVWNVEMAVTNVSSRSLAAIKWR